MSDRLYIIPADASPDDYPAADVILLQGGDVVKAAEDFCGMPGPRKIMTPSREDPTFLSLVAELDERCMEEDNLIYGYSVRITEGK